MVPLDKRPEALDFMVEPKSTAPCELCVALTRVLPLTGSPCEQAASLGFLETRVPRSGKVAREHLSVADVSSQVSLRWGCTRCGCLVTGVPSSVGLCVKEVTSLPGTPYLSPLLEEASGAALGAADGSPLPAGNGLCAHSDTTAPLSTGPREGLCAARAPAWKHTWVQTQLSILPWF